MFQGNGVYFSWVFWKVFFCAFAWDVVGKVFCFGKVVFMKTIFCLKISIIHETSVLSMNFALPENRFKLPPYNNNSITLLGSARGKGWSYHSCPTFFSTSKKQSTWIDTKREPSHPENY